MSIREVVEHVHVRGTAVSTSMMAPSTLHVSVVEKFGLPNRYGTIQCDDYLLHVRFDYRNESLVHVWAQQTQEQQRNVSACVVF